uniref:Uncharacterized protein n=1 Tax=Tanacetum cinerariifolium TaxID=118510 RepID=A0A699HSE1_TANCI|nr:hypothetical protein [Tanacetum cinerariifolium]
MSGLMTHDLEGHEFEKTCNNDKSLSEIQLENEKEDEFIVVWDCMMVVKEIVNRFLEEVGVSLFWEEGDDFGVDVLRFHTCLTDIFGFLEKLKWWFEQDIDDREEEDEEGEVGSEFRRDRCSSYEFHEEGFDGLERQHWTMRRCFGTEIRSWNAMIHHHFHQGYHLKDEMSMDDLEWWMRRN